jgi:adenine deaminase
MSPLEAMRSGTIHGARYLGMDEHLGTIEPGKLADIIVMSKDPLADIRNTESVRFTMVNGRLFDADTLDEIGNTKRSRAPFFFERSGAPDRMTLWNGGCAGCGIVGAGCEPQDAYRDRPWGYH